MKMMRSSAYIIIVSFGLSTQSGKITNDATKEKSAGDTGSPCLVPAPRGWYVPLSSGVEIRGHVASEV